jgi:hypothetical protein
MNAVHKKFSHPGVTRFNLSFYRAALSPGLCRGEMWDERNADAPRAHGWIGNYEIDSWPRLLGKDFSIKNI